MILPLLLGGAAVCIGVAFIYARRGSADGEPVSSTWLVANGCRERQQGYEAVSIRFPIQKFQNEHAASQTQKLRRQAREALGQRESVRRHAQGLESAVARTS